MGKTGCTIDGSLDASKFNEPMPWIGVYIAAASAACAIGMAIDAFHGIRYRKFWFPSKFFSLNATSLTLLAVATKLSVDLNTSMPRPQDQLAKLSSTILVCTVMANFMPSLGIMENKELLANMVALGIFVITVMVNICIELGTGVIYVFWREYAVNLAIMLILLALKISSALTIPTTKKYFEMKSKKKLKLAKLECNDKSKRCPSQKLPEKLKEDLTKYWMMAHTCNPQFVMARLATCSASGAFCLISTATLAEAMIRCFFMPSHFKFCEGNSDYKWSTTLILIIQAIAIGIGTVAPASRYFATINFRCPKKAMKACRDKFKMEKYWTVMFILLRESPLEWRLYSKHGRKLVYTVKDKALDLCVYSQIGVVWLSKLVRLISLMLIIRFLLGYQSFLRLIRWVRSDNRFHEPESDSQHNPMQELGRFVMNLEGEEEFIDMMMQRNCDATGHWIRMGRKDQPKHVIRLLEKLCSSREFEGVNRFDSDLVHSLDSDEPPNCWALPVVTLTSIAVALPNVDLELKKELIRSVHEALTYIRFIENSLDPKKELTNLRKAAAALWTGIDLHYKWLDVDLRKIALQNKIPKEIFEELANEAKHRYKVFRENDPLACIRENAANWPTKVLIANSMYRICQTLLVSSKGREWESGKLVFDELSTMIAEIIGACFTNLQYIISEQSHQSSIEEREDRTRHSILLLGKTEKILEILEQQTLPSYKPDQSLHIDQWRLLSRRKSLLESSSSMTDDTTTRNSPDLYLNIDS
ncbi:OLC1v1031860C1 [Oldenlandia corymbosa var. corymbosa]|uniref:OLC1v1031860C1 n=1 Tax=Oldenlandia corymbosa var. corymbosa TaxID=529605 RepID=A0AAV1CMR0_OLDCO|nr:OLC1v1031860C1 [Oldenlandia corymbosa var. corymbosa]